jgi:DNA-binding Xre family transcriptional regulator
MPKGQRIKPEQIVMLLRQVKMNKINFGVFNAICNLFDCRRINGYFY